MLRALLHPVRIRILKYLGDNERACVTDIFVFLKLEQSIVSQHLGILRRANVVQVERHGKFVFYTLRYDKLRYIADSVRALAAGVRD
jgi:DNA-binding transcriptional ArsR family regulator